MARTLWPVHLFALWPVLHGLHLMTDVLWPMSVSHGLCLKALRLIANDLCLVACNPWAGPWYDGRFGWVAASEIFVKAIHVSSRDSRFDWEAWAGLSMNFDSFCEV